MTSGKLHDASEAKFLHFCNADKMPCIDTVKFKGEVTK